MWMNYYFNRFWFRETFLQEKLNFVEYVPGIFSYLGLAQYQGQTDTFYFHFGNSMLDVSELLSTNITGAGWYFRLGGGQNGAPQVTLTTYFHDFYASFSC